MARRNIKQLETALGYRFKSRAVLDRALTHASTRSDQSKGEDNERLEFLGDRVLGLAVAELLLDRGIRSGLGLLERHGTVNDTPARARACAVPSGFRVSGTVPPALVPRNGALACRNEPRRGIEEGARGLHARRRRDVRDP